MDLQKLYKSLESDAPEYKLKRNRIAEPDASVESEVTAIYAQARKHRNDLLRFYIWYTIIFSFFVWALVFLQAYARVALRSDTLEIVPQWALYLLVTGMFAQFVGLLHIVTRRVWEFKPFFDHFKDMKSNKGSSRDKH